MIWFLLKLFFVKWTTIKRWNNFPRVEDVSPLDNAGFVIHIALFMAYLEEKQGKIIDKEFIMKKIIFGLFQSLILSDINSGTKNYLLKENHLILEELEEKVLNYICSLEWADFLKKDIKKILWDKSDRIENKIILWAKNYAWLKECQVNAKIFDYAFDIALEEINQSLNFLKKDLFSLNEILINENYQKYLTHIRRLSHAMRWSWKKRNFPISVMSHLVIVSFISYCLANIEDDKEYDIYEIMKKSIYHDIPEAITGDIITPIKNSVSWFRNTLEKVEEKMLNNYFFIYIDNDYKKEIKDYMLNPFEGKIWKLAKNSDIISALLEARIERDWKNDTFIKIYKKIKFIVNKFETKSSNYFLKDVLLDFGEDIWDIKF